MKVLRCHNDEFGHHLREGRDMIKAMYQIVRRRKRNSSSEIIVPNSVIHHLDSDRTRAEILILIFHATGKLVKIGKKILCSPLLEFFKMMIEEQIGFQTQIRQDNYVE